MNDRDRFKLSGGPCPHPPGKGRLFLRCEIRRTARVRGIHEARIQWPYTLQKNGGGCPALILCGELVRVESATAICHWWGVGSDRVRKWRRALGVQTTNEGTADLKGRWAPELILR